MIVLFVELTDGTGGSTLSLLQLLAHFPRQPHWRPMVALPEHNRRRHEFEAMGVPLLVLPGATRRTSSQPAPSAGKRLLVQRGWYRSLSARRRFSPLVETPGGRLAETFLPVHPALCYVNNGLVIGAPAVFAAAALGLPILCHERGFQPIHGPYRKLARSVSRFVCISNAVREHLTRAGLADASEVIYNGIDLTRYHPELPADPALSGDGPLLVSTGRLTGWKGVHDLIEAARLLRTEFPALRVAIAGTGDQEHALRAQVHDAGLSDRVSFLGFVDDPRPVVRAATVLVHTATEPEPFGRTVLEGLALGVPVVGTSLGGIPEILEDGVCGRLVPPGKPVELARVLGELLKDPDQRSRLVVAGRARAETRFDQTAGSAKIAARIEHLLGHSKTGRD